MHVGCEELNTVSSCAV